MNINVYVKKEENTENVGVWRILQMVIEKSDGKFGGTKKNYYFCIIIK